MKKIVIKRIILIFLLHFSLFYSSCINKNEKYDISFIESDAEPIYRIRYMYENKLIDILTTIRYDKINKTNIDIYQHENNKFRLVKTYPSFKSIAFIGKSENNVIFEIFKLDIKKQTIVDTINFTLN